MGGILIGRSAFSACAFTFATSSGFAAVLGWVTGISHLQKKLHLCRDGQEMRDLMQMVLSH